MEYITLNNGVKMPMAGLGTFLMSPQEAEDATYNALISGYPLIDTANGYSNERGTGRGIKKSGVKREDVFLVTKLWPSVYEDENAIEDTLKRLDTDYIDLLFLHQPVGAYIEGYKMIEKAYKEGKVKAIGISNFPDDRFQRILDECEIVPQVVQVEAHPYYPQNELKEKFLKKYNIALMAWYPLGHGDKSLQQEEIFTKLAEKYGKSNVQIILRWHIQEGHVIIPGSKNPAHIKDNINIFDFALTDEEMAEIAKVNKNVRYYNMSIEDAEARYTKICPDFNAQE